MAVLTQILPETAAIKLQEINNFLKSKLDFTVNVADWYIYKCRREVGEKCLKFEAFVLGRILHFLVGNVAYDYAGPLKCSTFVLEKITADPPVNRFGFLPPQLLGDFHFQVYKCPPSVIACCTIGLRTKATPELTSFTALPRCSSIGLPLIAAM